MEEQNIPKNPLLERALIPGETFRLPSQGLFYHNGELSNDVVNGEIHVRAMTAIDEIVFKSPDMLFTGKAVEEVFARCVPQILKPSKLLSKDVDYLLMCLRLVTYGPTVQVSYKHDCGVDSDGNQIESHDHVYEVPIQPLIQKAKQIDPTTLNALFAVTLPNGQQVRLKPLTYDTMIALNQDIDLENKNPSLDEIKSSVMAVIVDAIDSVDGISDKKMISDWVEVLSAGWIRQITEVLGATSDWGATPITQTKCKDCGADIEIEFSVNPISFFS